MKKIIRLIMVATAVMIMAAGCSSAYDEPEAAPDDVQTVTLSLRVSAEDTDDFGATRADAAHIDRLVVAVYDLKGNLLPELGQNDDGQTIIDISSFPAQVDLTLVKGQEYKIAFWACSSEFVGNGYDTSDLRNVKADYSKLPAGSGLADAFFKTETFTAVANGMRPVTLRRAMATLNFIMLPEYFDEVKSQGGSSVEVSAVGLPQTFDVLTGSVGDFSENSVAFPPAAIGDSRLNVNLGELFPTPEGGFPLLASAYTFAPELSAALPSLTLSVPGVGAVATEGLIYQRNHSTNVLISSLNQ